MVLIIPLIITSVFFFIGIWMLRNIFNKKKLCINKTEATIIDYRKRSGKDDEGQSIDQYLYIYEYCIENKQYTDSSATPESYPMYKIGDKIKLKYNPENPSQNYTNDDSLTMILGGIICIVIGGGFSVLLIYLLIS